MGTSTSVGEFASKLHRAGVAIEGGTTAGVTESAVVAKEIFLANLPARSLRGMGGARLGAYFLPPRSSKNPQALVAYSGPVHILNNPTSPHPIYPRGARIIRNYGRGDSRNLRRSDGRTRRNRGARAGGATALKFPSGEFALYANHPGTAGKNFFPRVKAQVAQTHPRAVARGTRQALARVF